MEGKTMPKNKDLKRLVRERMRKTGESYTAARSKLLREKPAPGRDLAAIAGMSDAAVKAKTGRTWREWIEGLDALDAHALSHRDIARRLHGEFGLPGWWAQMVTVGYERVRGLREKGQRRGGGYEVSKSRTYPVPVGDLFAAFGETRRWLTDAKLTPRGARPVRSMRFSAAGGTRLEVSFRPKGEGKSQVQIQQGRFPTRAEADAARARWATRLDALGELLVRDRP
jgi:hypothetical protein